MVKNSNLVRSTEPRVFLYRNRTTMTDVQTVYKHIIKAIAVLLCILVIYGLTTKVPDNAQPNIKYVINFDAGSTGTRMHVFTFSLSNQVKLLKEDFYHVKPGLSAYAHHPKECIPQLKQLLDKAVELIPSEHHEATPLSLKATAGLRLLTKTQVQSIFDQVLSLFKKYNFNIDLNPVEVLSGKEEGIFGWLTLNFLLGTLDEVEGSQQTVGAIDLGGASTQITFVPQFKETFERYSSDIDQVKILILKKHMTLYTRSYLGYGLKYSRFSMFGGHKNILTQTSRLDSNKLSSPCLPVNYSRPWKHEGSEYIVSGPAKQDGRFDGCLATAHMHLFNKIDQPKEISTIAVNGFSYLFDQLHKAGAIGSSGDTLSVSLICGVAHNECRKQNLQKTFLCADLSYICTLLTHGYGLHPESNIHLIKKLKGYEVSWSLGAALITLL